jgi:DNA-binding transcriptional ArsR family regulator
MVVNRLDLTFAALCDPTRRKIVDRLTRGPASVTELAEPFKISQQAISKHLSYLQRAGLVERRGEGRIKACLLRPQALHEVARWAEGYRRFWERSFEGLDSLLEDMKAGELAPPREKRKRSKP